VGVEYANGVADYEIMMHVEQGVNGRRELAGIERVSVRWCASRVAAKEKPVSSVVSGPVPLRHAPTPPMVFDARRNRNLPARRVALRTCGRILTLPQEVELDARELALRRKKTKELDEPISSRLVSERTSRHAYLTHESADHSRSQVNPLGLETMPD
jgi:hypothetical protein